MFKAYNIAMRINVYIKRIIPKYTNKNYKIPNVDYIKNKI